MAVVPLAMAEGPVIDSSVIIAIVTVGGTLLGIAVAKILGSNTEELKRLANQERRAYALENYLHRVRDAFEEQGRVNDALIKALDKAGVAVPVATHVPLPPWPTELTRGSE